MSLGSGFHEDDYDDDDRAAPGVDGLKSCQNHSLIDEREKKCVLCNCRSNSSTRMNCAGSYKVLVVKIVLQLIALIKLYTNNGH